jgi:hypothetical protein
MPFSWMDATRTASSKVPADALIGPAVSSTFCGAVANASRFINLKAQTPVGAAVVTIAILALTILAFGLTRWWPSGIEPLRQARAGGQIILSAARVYGRHLGAVVLIALATLLAIGSLDGLAWVLRHAVHASGSGTSVTDAVPSFGPSPWASVGRTLAPPFASALVIAFIRNLEQGRDTRLRAAGMAVLRRVWRLLAAQVVILVVLIALAATIIGIPLAVLKFIDWQFAQQEILFEDRSILDALRGSTRVVRQHSWRNALGTQSTARRSPRRSTHFHKHPSGRPEPHRGRRVCATNLLRGHRSHPALSRPELPPRARPSPRPTQPPGQTSTASAA